MYSIATALLLFCCVAGSGNVAASPAQDAFLTQNPVVIAIPADGEFYLGRRTIAQADIPESLKRLLKDRPADEQVVYIKAANDVKYGTVVTLVNAIRDAGIDQIGLVANKKKETGQPTPPESNLVEDPSSAIGERTPSDQIPIVIEFKSKTDVRLNSARVTISRLGSRLKATLARRTDKAIFIKAPSEMSYGDVVKIIDLAKAAGARPIGLQVL